MIFEDGKKREFFEKVLSELRDVLPQGYIVEFIERIDIEDMLPQHFGSIYHKDRGPSDEFPIDLLYDKYVEDDELPYINILLSFFRVGCEEDEDDEEDYEDYWDDEDDEDEDDEYDGMGDIIDSPEELLESIHLILMDTSAEKLQDDGILYRTTPFGVNAVYTLRLDDPLGAECLAPLNVLVQRELGLAEEEIFEKIMERVDGEDYELVSADEASAGAPSGSLTDYLTAQNVYTDSDIFLLRPRNNDKPKMATECVLSADLMARIATALKSDFCIMPSGLNVLCVVRYPAVLPKNSPQQILDEFYLRHRKHEDETVFFPFWGVLRYERETGSITLLPDRPSCEK